MTDSNKLMETFLNKTILFKYKFGFLGEVYIDANEFEEEYDKFAEILEKYFSFKKPFYCNRNSTYYSKDLLETTNLIKYIVLDATKIIGSEIGSNIKRFIIFSLTEYMLSCIAKIIGVIFSYTSLKNNYYEALKKYILELTDYIVQIIFDEELKAFPSLSLSFVDNILSDMKNLNISNVREFSEMDNILIMFISYFSFYDYIGEHDIIISPLQGAAILAPFYISMHKYTMIRNRWYRLIDFEYVRFSRYDNTHYCQSSLHEQIQELNTKYPNTIKIILIDDNTGTAITLNTIKQEIINHFNNISTCAVEYYWEAKIYKADTYPAFKLDDIDFITPICYRHFSILNEQIDYIKNGSELHNRYNGNKFNKLNMIYDEIDYFMYIDKNCREASAKARILNIYERLIYIMDIMLNFNT